MKKTTLLLPFLLMLFHFSAAQPFADIANFNCQSFSTSGNDVTKWKIHSDDYFANIFLPITLKGDNKLLFRINSEVICTTLKGDSSYTSKLKSLSIPLGAQIVSKSKKYSTVFMIIPKFAGDMKSSTKKDYFQFGGLLLENFILNDRLKFKLGFYLNNEAFGLFPMPLIGMDWKVNNRLYLYGTLPSNYRIELNILKNRLYTGLGFKSLTRSFQLSRPYSFYPEYNNTAYYVRYDEMQLKWFVDCFVIKGLLLYAEAGYNIGKNPLQYLALKPREQSYINPVYTPMKPYMLINIGIAYRIRTDLQKNEEKENP